MKPEIFRLDVPDSALADLRERLKRTRWPDEPPLEAWSTGTSVTYMKELVAYWLDRLARVGKEAERVPAV